MLELQELEKYEIEVLENLKKAGLLRDLVFVGGTMLRLCHELPRYSIDLDFWLYNPAGLKKIYPKLKLFGEKNYQVTDLANKYNTILLEIRSPKYGRRLKLEIRKQTGKKMATEEKIAYSVYADKQVLVKTLTLQAVFQNKVQAALDRQEIRDFFDLEFLLRKGLDLNLYDQEKEKLQKICQKFKKNDFSVKLGSLLDSELRKYYNKNGFKFLMEKLNISK